MSNFTQFGLSSPIMKAIEEMGYSQPTPVQAQTLPIILEGTDLRASAQTGTGKTAAFLLPAIQHLSQSSQEKKKNPTVLILVPTRELAMQVSDEAKKYTKYLPHIQTVCIYGGVPYPIQNKALQKRYDILVATPGRLLDHMDRGRINLSDVKILVLDEADRMLDMGFIDDVEKIVRSMPKTRQTLLFSATLDGSILPISKKLQNNPAEVRIESPAEEKHPVEQHLYYVDNLSHKVQILEHLLATTEFNQTLVFTSTISQADELAEKLCDMGHNAASLHGDMNQRQRTRTIDRVRKGSIRVLVATDVAARGIDISTVGLVFNFDLPLQIENYVHRIGRTGRAGAKGVAISFVSHREESLLVRIKKLTSMPMECKTIEGMEPKGKSSRRSDSSQSRPRGGFGGKGGFAARRSEGGFRNKRSESDFGGQRPESSFRPRRSEGNFKAQGSEAGVATKSDGDVDGNKTESRFERRRPEGAFKPRRFEGEFRRERPEGAFQPRRSESEFRKERPEGGFRSKRPEGNFAPKLESDVDGNRDEGSFKPRRSEGAFRRERPEGSFRPRRSEGSYGDKKSNGSFGRKPGGSFGYKRPGSSFSKKPATSEQPAE